FFAYCPNAVIIQSSSSRLNIPKIVLLLVGIMLLMVPLRLLSFGYLPPDDALRYAAKAVSGKSWSEIVIMRPEITMDHNPGWNLTLTLLHRVTHWDTWMLVAFSVVVMFLVVAFSP